MSDSVRPPRRQPTRLPRPWDSPGKNTGVGCHFLLQRTKVKNQSEVAQSCPTLSDPMDCSPPGFSIHGIFQARVLEWGAIAFSDHTVGSHSWFLPETSPHLWMDSQNHLIIIIKDLITLKDSLSPSSHTQGEGNGNPTPVFLPGKSQGRGSLVGCRLGGRTESNRTDAT